MTVGMQRSFFSTFYWPDEPATAHCSAISPKRWRPGWLAACIASHPGDAQTPTKRSATELKYTAGAVAAGSNLRRRKACRLPVLPPRRRLANAVVVAPGRCRGRDDRSAPAGSRALADCCPAPGPDGALTQDIYPEWVAMALAPADGALGAGLLRGRAISPGGIAPAASPSGATWPLWSRATESLRPTSRWSPTGGRTGSCRLPPRRLQQQRSEWHLAGKIRGRLFRQLSPRARSGTGAPRSPPRCAMSPDIVFLFVGAARGWPRSRRKCAPAACPTFLFPAPAAGAASAPPWRRAMCIWSPSAPAGQTVVFPRQNCTGSPPSPGALVFIGPRESELAALVLRPRTGICLRPRRNRRHCGLPAPALHRPRRMSHARRGRRGVSSPRKWPGPRVTVWESILGDGARDRHPANPMTPDEFRRPVVQPCPGVPIAVC